MIVSIFIYYFAGIFNIIDSFSLDVEAVAVEAVAVEVVAVAAGVTVTPVVTPSEAEFDCAHRCSSSYISSELLVVHRIPKLIQHY